MEKTYQAAVIEENLYARWEKEGAFACAPQSGKMPYTIMMPPPNVTGSLHMGHALTFTLQDVLVRYQRMAGKDVLWQPGTDHAGIATQMVVEKQLAAQKLQRREMGREKFLEKIWAWKEESGGMITRQLRRLGASPDWSRERFTMDEGLNKAVTRVFVQLYREGLIYKDNRLVNWDPKLLTAISDLEVETKEVKGSLWHFRYPIEGSDDYIVVATTRPETMLGDTAVAVHPENEKLKHFIGKMVKLPLVGRLIPVVGDDYADPEKGTGAVKITPAHDFNDFEVGKRHKLPMINVLDKFGKVNGEVPEAYRGLDRFAARKKIVEDMESAGLLEKIEPHTHQVPHGDRSGVVIEPWLTEQWYCNAEKLAQPVIKAVEEGKTQFVPQQWTNTYFEWMRNIQPWCISRQLWWGHQIPAWYDDKGKVYVAENEAGAQQQAGTGVKLTRDDDVLDTWFSSALWPFSTLGWPDKTPELQRYYPTDVLVTGFDIIFFWVARMMMMGQHFMGDVPFKTVYIHALVRDEKGQKMSKSKGNVIDPLLMIDQYGTDALRFTLVSLSTPGRDIKLATGRIEGGRNFVTKLWNAARFCEINECTYVAGFSPASVQHTINRWIISEYCEVVRKATKAIENYRFDDMANALYQFSWNLFCDWYLEFSKPLFQGSDAAVQAETRATAAFVLDGLLHLLQPIMPYITQEIWGHTHGGLLMQASWPQAGDDWGDDEAMMEVRWIISAIMLIRSVRSELNVPAAAQIPLIVNGASADETARLKHYEHFIVKMARVASVTLNAPIPTNAAQAVLGQAIFVLPLAGVLDLAVERARLEKEKAKVLDDITKTEQKLQNPAFVDKAPEDVVNEHRERLVTARQTLETIQAAAARLAG